MDFVKLQIYKIYRVVYFERPKCVQKIVTDIYTVSVCRTALLCVCVAVFIHCVCRWSPQVHRFMIPPAGCVHAEGKDVCVIGLVSVCRFLCFAKDSAAVQRQQEALVLVFKVPEHMKTSVPT